MTIERGRDIMTLMALQDGFGMIASMFPCSKRFTDVENQDVDKFGHGSGWALRIDSLETSWKTGSGDFPHGWAPRMDSAWDLLENMLLGIKK